MEYEEQKLEHFKGQDRLPKFAVPKRYDLTLKPDLSSCKFFGTVFIEISIVQLTRFIVLNALELDIGEVSFISSHNHKHVPSDVVVESDGEILVLVFDEAIIVGNGVLEISFSGVLNEHMKGFYRGSYVDGGVKKNMAVTQFEAADARRCFPCWDEPALKATFKITVGDIPLELTPVSNMPICEEKITGDLKTVYFEESPIMSTYLVAVVVGLFDYIEDATTDGIKVRAYCPVGESKKGKLALDIAVKALDLYSNYFSVPYALPKLDMVAVSDFQGGAMENYGLLVYRENELLHDGLHSTAASTQWLAIVTTHEVAHQWFGNLVTMEWWTDIWLNEGFATWVSYLATDTLFPEWNIWNKFLKGSTGGLRMDALEQSHPIEVEIPNVRLVDEIFDAISYRKGSSVIRMLQDYLGDDIFQKSISAYIKRYACKNAKTEDLWSIISEESGIQVNKIMDIWTKQKGYPVISVTSKNHILEFEQSQFLYSGLRGNTQWIVPITLSLGSYKKRRTFLLETKVGTLDVSELYLGSSSSHAKNNCEEHEENLWVKVNIGQTGFYRVKYDDELTAQLRKAIKDNHLSAADKLGLLDDTYALCEACEVSLSSLLPLMDVYRKELDYIVLSRLIDICYDIVKISTDAIPYLVDDLKQYFINLILSSAEKIGWESVSGESHSSTLLREEVLMALTTFGHISTCEEAVKRYHAYLEDRNTPLFPVDVRRAAYIVQMSNTSSTSRKGLESLLKLYREADAVQEKMRILRSLPSCPDPVIVLEILNFVLSDEFHEADAMYVLSWISLEGREIAWTWLKENWDLILKRWGTGFLLHCFIRGIVTPFCSYEKADQVEAFFESRTHPSFDKTLKQSIEQVRIKARWIENIKQEDSLKEMVKGLACTGITRSALN